ncbi:MAG: hypothetical protein D6790_20260 [Caldilineae bacterium]|nr:MAG: hypothetical protein D6790_20260 [Caldilineae bacterium]
MSQRYVLDAEERRRRLAALLESLLYTFVQPSGAMRNTQNPHIVDVSGVLTYSTGPAPAPLLSPLDSNFAAETERVAQALNRIHAGRVQVQSFGSLGALAEILQDLVNEGQPYAVTV